MDNDDFYVDHYDPRMLIEAMMQAGGFRIEYRRERSYSLSSDISPIRRRSISPECRKGEFEILPSERFNGKKQNYNDIAQKNAEQLIKEEEHARIKAEKKKAKKERQKMKKQQSKEINCVVNNTNSDNLTNKISSDLGNLNIASDNKEMEMLDVNAAFVSKAVKKVKNPSIIMEEPKRERKVKDIIYLINKAQEYESSENYNEAVQYLSDAINLQPQSIDIILERSFCYFELAKFEKSIRDAKKVIEYSPNNPHGYYRLGEGHFALANFSAAEAAFTKLLSLNSYIEESKNRLFSIRVKQLEQMGYHPNEAFTALRNSKNKTLDEAIDFLEDLENGQNKEDLYYSDDDDDDDNDDENCEDNEEEELESTESNEPCTSTSGKNFKVPLEINNKSPLFTDPSNPLGCCALFIGNLKKGIAYKELHDVFIRFGDINNIKLITEPNCYAFVNYTTADAAGQAMAAMQGSRWLLSTVPLVVKYPVNVIRNIIPTLKNPENIQHLLAVPLPVRKPTPVRAATVTSDTASEGETQLSVVQKPVSGKPRPPHKTQECFYWRTMGCNYGDKCFNLHIPRHKGIDMMAKRSCRK